MIKQLLQGIFSIKNEYNVKRMFKHKVITLCFLKFKIGYKPKSIVIIGPGGIGDYIQTRPYYKYFKTLPKYKDYKIVYVERTGIVEIARSIDKKCFDETIEFTYGRFVKERKYRNSVLKKINSNRIEKFINLQMCSLWGKQSPAYPIMVKGIKTKEKIAFFHGDTKIRKRKNKALKSHNKIFINEDYLFVDKQRQWIFEQIFEQPIPIETDLKIPPLYDVNKKHIAVSIMASSEERRYPEEKWTIVLNHLLDNIDEDTEIFFLGKPNEQSRIEDLIRTLNHQEKCINMAGLISTPMLPMILKDCKFLISVETGTVHFAHAMGIKSICVCNGQVYGWFHPYKENVEYVYPKEFIQRLGNDGERFKKDAYEVYKYNILTESIEVQDIIKAIDKMLTETKQITPLPISIGGGELEKQKSVV